MRLRRLAFLALVPLTLAACDGKMLSDLPGFGKKPEAAQPVAPAEAPKTPQPPAVSPLEVPIETGGATTTLGNANAAFVGVSAFNATGHEPGWAVDVNGGGARVQRAGVKDATVAVRRIDFGQGAEFVGELGGATFSLNLRTGDCTTAAGDKWPMTATMRASGKAYRGCARPDANPKAIKVAAKPAVKAKPKAKTPAKPKVTPKPTTPAPTTPAPAPTTPTPTTPAPTTPTPTEPVTTPTAPSTTPTTPAPSTTTPTPAPTTPTPATTTTTTTTPVVVPPVGTTPATN